MVQICYFVSNYTFKSIHQNTLGMNDHTKKLCTKIMQLKCFYVKYISYLNPDTVKRKIEKKKLETWKKRYAQNYGNQKYSIY